jgi:hypothetical protein
VHQRLVEQPQRVLRELEAVEVGGERGGDGGIDLAALVEIEARADALARERDRARLALVDQPRIDAQVGECRGRLVAVLRRDLRGAASAYRGVRREDLAHAARIPDGGAARDGCRIRAPLRGEVGERPAVGFRDLGVRTHRRSRHAERERVVQPVDAALALPRRVVEIRGRGVHALGERAVAAPVHAVASGAVLGEEQLGAREIGCAPRAEAHAVGGDDGVAQATCRRRDRFGIRLRRDQPGERHRHLAEALALRARRQLLQPDDTFAANSTISRYSLSSFTLPLATASP